MPPEALEAIVGLFVPPACREEVLGDLHEQYRGTVSYVLGALRAVPFVIVSRIRRTTGAEVLAMEALLLYASFVAAAWYTDSTLLTAQWGLLELAVPVMFALLLLMLDDAWVPQGQSPLQLIRGLAIAIIFGCFCERVFLPAWLNFRAACLGLLLVSPVRVLFRPGTQLTHAAAGPAAWVNPRTGSTLVKTARSLITVAAEVMLAVLFLERAGHRPGAPGFARLVAFLVAFEIFRSRKERSR